MTVFGLLAGSATWGVFWGGWAALLPAIKQQAGVSPAELGLALLAIPVGALPAMLGMGPLYDRHGRRAFGVTLALFAAAAVLPGFAHGVWPLAGALLLVGATSGAIEVGLNAATAAEEAATGRRLFHTVHAVTPIAMIVAAPAVGALRQVGVTALPILLGIALVVLASVVPNLGGPAPAVVSASRPGARFAWSSRLLLYGGAGAAVLFMENAVEQWSAVLLDEEYGAGAFVASLGPGLYMAALAFGRLVAQRYGAGLTPRRAVALAGVTGAVGMGLAAGAGTMLGAVGGAARPALALAGFAVSGLGIAAALPTLLGAAGRDASDARRGASVSTVTTVSYLGFLASPAVVGGAAGLVTLPGALGAVAALGAVLALAALALPAGAVPRSTDFPGKESLPPGV